ncbi:outer membrane protein [Arsenicitalea aurantiaca]|nr:outer membrane protein [Arsenicitalea aurantiaca]
MNFATKLLASAAALAVMTGSVYAADLYIPVEQPYIPEVSAPLNWTGAYVGVHAGYGWGDVDVDGFAVDGEDIDGWLAGVQAGYNVNLDGVVLGIEGDIAWANISGSYEDAGTTTTATVDWLATIRGRVGFAADAFLIYGTAGVAFAGVDVDFDGGSTQFPDDSDSNTHTGWVVGAGIETMVTETISLKAEYLYHDFGSQDYSLNSIPGEGSLNVSTAKIGLNFHF